MKAVSPAFVILAQLKIQIANATLYRSIMIMLNTQTSTKNTSKILYIYAVFLGSVFKELITGSIDSACPHISRPISVTWNVVRI
jgi:hypothetical protein